MHTVYMFTLYYEATKRFTVSMAFAIVPDSCLYVVMMALLIPILGKDGIWLAITGNQVIGLIVLIPIVWIIGARSGKRTDHLLLSVLSAPDRTDAAIRLVGELVSEMRQTSKDIHIKLRDEGEEIRLFVRSLGKQWELPAAIPDNVGKMVGNASVSYSYVYKMNIVCLTFAGKRRC